MASSAEWRCSWASWSRNSGSWSQRCKVRRPTLQRREAWAMGGGGENGESRLPALGEAGVFYFSAVVSHCEPWPQWPFDRFGRVLIAAYQQRREWSPEGSRARCREFRTGGPFSFRDDSCFPMHFGFVQWQSNIKNVWIPAFAGKTGERRDGFPLPDRGRGQASRE